MRDIKIPKRGKKKPIERVQTREHDVVETFCFCQAVSGRLDRGCTTSAAAAAAAASDDAHVRIC